LKSTNAEENANEVEGWLDEEDVLDENDSVNEGFDDRHATASSQNTGPGLEKKQTEDDLFGSMSLKQTDVDHFFPSSVVGARKIGGAGGTNIGSRPMTSSSTSSLYIPNKKKQSLAERKVEYTQRKMVREKSKQSVVVGVKKLSDDHIADGWDDF